jgi:hypothetical protein
MNREMRAATYDGRKLRRRTKIIGVVGADIETSLAVSSAIPPEKPTNATQTRFFFESQQGFWKIFCVRAGAG